VTKSLVLAVLDRTKERWTRLPRAVIVLCFVFAGCGYSARERALLRETQARSTFEKFVRLAQAGDAKSQNVVGFMHYFGEGAPTDYYLAHRWFHAAADQGYVNAQLNLAVMHYLGRGVPEDLEEAERYFHLARQNGLASPNFSGRSTLPDSLAALAEGAIMAPQVDNGAGELAYVTFCAGCHGFNGIAAYVGSPSFALGERMEKSDAELMFSITRGHGIMPSWDNKLSLPELMEALQFVRTLPRQYQNGIAQVLRAPPELYFRFGPMSRDLTGRRDENPD
jgi:mono/diheme cytochrome c family protein